MTSFRNLLTAVLAVIVVGGALIAAAPSGGYTLHEGQHYFNSNVNVDGTLTQAGSASYTSGLTVTGGTVNLNASSNNAVNIGTGTTTSAVTLGGTGTQTIAVGTGAGIKTVNVGSATTTSATTIASGTGDLALSSTDDATITITDDLTINGGSAGSIISIGTNTEGNVGHIFDNDTTADTLTICSAKDTCSLAGIAVTVGSTGTTSALTLQSGTGDVTVTSTDDFSFTATDDIAINGGSAGSIINIGTNTHGDVINIGTDNTAADTINIGSALDSVVLTGGVDMASTTVAGSCTLNGGSPSTCTATVIAGSKCTCSPVGATAAIATGGCAVGLASTTLTLTGPNAGNWDVNYHCF